MYLQDVSNVPFTTTLVKIKYEAASEYAKNNNYIYQILFDEDVKKFGLDLQKLKESELVKLD